MIKPVVGITAWKTAPSDGDEQAAHSLSDEYVRAIQLAGATPVVLPSLPREEAPALLDLIDGLVIAGGERLSSGKSGEAEHFESALIRFAESRDLPVLGICRGCELLNVAFGGTVNESAFDEPDLQREIELVPGSTLAGIYGKTRRVIPRTKGSRIGVVADGFRVVASSKGGVTEAIEATGAWLAVGVQWHPERLDLREEGPLFLSFVDAIRSHISEPGGVHFS